MSESNTNSSSSNNNDKLPNIIKMNNITDQKISNVFVPTKVVNSIKACDTDETQECPLCRQKVRQNPRYPKYLCKSCKTLPATDIDGNKVVFSNIDECGGFLSLHYNDSNDNTIYEQKSDSRCWINGIKCYADEARFGGIIIQTV